MPPIPSSSLDLDLHHDKPDLDSMLTLVVSINRSILSFLETPQSRSSAYRSCTSRLHLEKQDLFDFSEQSVLSNLYWGIDCIESAIQETCPDERQIRLSKAEKMLQVPALLDDQDVTAGIDNACLVCCSYFYLAVIRRLQSDEWQVALHFLQALLVCPRLVRTELAPELCDSLFTEDELATGRLARKYKDWLVYYQVMLYGETPHWHRHVPQPKPHLHLLNRTFESSNSTEQRDQLQFQNKVHPQHNTPHVKSPELQFNTRIKCLQDILNDSESDTSTSADLHEIPEGNMTIAKLDADDLEPENSDQKLQIGSSMYRAMSLPRALEPKHANEVNIFSSRSISELNLSVLEISNTKSNSTRWKPEEVELFHHIASTCNQTTAARKNNRPRFSTTRDRDPQSETLDKAVSKLCLPGKCQEDYFAEVKIIYEMLNRKAGERYEVLKDTLLDQLLTAISTSKEEGIVRASVSILTTIVSENKSAIEDIKKKGLQLCHLATALKRNVYEAATLIYLINPSPSEIKTLEVLPTLVEVVCTYNNINRLPQTIPLTPPTASLMIIELLVTAFDYDTNNSHLAAINSPRVLCALVHVAKKDNLEEFISLATILVKCMQFDGQSRKYISEFTPMGPFICLLGSSNERAQFIALEFFHEILRMPRSSAISLLQRMRNEGNMDSILGTLLQCARHLETDYQLLAANLLLQLDIQDESSSRITMRDEAIEVLFKAVAPEESPNAQLLSTFILSNLGGTFSWTGEPYTVAWLVKKAGLTSLTHRNMIRNFDWLDQNLQDPENDLWCSKIAKSIIHTGNHVFHALAKGLKSKIKRVSVDSLTAIAWLGYEIRKCPNNVKFSACEILLSGLEQFLHPGLELEERLLACLCIYNYTSGKGMQKVIHFSEGVRESLRRFSNVTWMAEELHKVADYILPNKSRISCVHTQILEASQNRSGAVNALIYYKGLLYSGYSDGSIKVWEIKRQSAKLMWSIKEHRRAVTCFSLFEPGESLLSGSADKTIRVWQVIQGKLECTEVIPTKDPVQKLDSYGDMIFVKTQAHSMKVLDSSRKWKDICKSKKVKCMKMFQGKIYVGCADSSIQELATTHNREREIKAPAKSWMMQNKPINSIAIYKDWLYSASSIVEGSNLKEWRRHSEPQVSIRPERRASVVAMGVVEDFIYLNFSSTPTILQIWLRSTAQKVGRLSAGSKITSVLTANDMILCGTETGLIKGWIPL